jgi:regulator of sigma D
MTRVLEILLDNSHQAMFPDMTNVSGLHAQGQNEYVFRRQRLQRFCHNLLTTQASVLHFHGLDRNISYYCFALKEIEKP